MKLAATKSNNQLTFLVPKTTFQVCYSSLVLEYILLGSVKLYLEYILPVSVNLLTIKSEQNCNKN